MLDPRVFAAAFAVNRIDAFPRTKSVASLKAFVSIACQRDPSVVPVGKSRFGRQDQAATERDLDDFVWAAS